ncbi:MAG TPA: HAD family hydrolase [Smithellaceae bacterium]|nr:HAD family hydrolase [Smithellaceae bacterium]
MRKTIRAVLFDLDDTLLENNMERFLTEYFKLLTPQMAHLVAPDKFISALIKATHAMVKNNDPAITNQQAFIADFFPRVGRKAEEMMPLFDDFYAYRFGRLQQLTRPNPASRAVIQAVLDKGCDVIIATNPIFPETAIKQRIQWAGLADFPFRLITTYENMHFAKPNFLYYREILKNIDRHPAECIMVGDDWNNDISPAMQADMKVFWISKPPTISAADSNKCARGTLAEFREWFADI